MKKFKLWKIVSLLILVFLAGGITGSVITGYVVKRALAGAFDFDRLPDGLVHKLEENMTLTADQKVQIRGVGERLAVKMKNTLDGAIAESGLIIVQAQREVDAALTPEQQIIHARMKAEFRKGLKERLGVTLPEE